MTHRQRTPSRNNKTQRDTRSTFVQTMRRTRTHMNPLARGFSRTIHWRPIEITLGALSETVARPNAVLYGAVIALITTCGTYVIAKHYGYPLSGSEPLFGFVTGWLLGIAIDYIQLLIRGGRRSRRR